MTTPIMYTPMLPIIIHYYLLLLVILVILIDRKTVW